MGRVRSKGGVVTREEVKVRWEKRGKTGLKLATYERGGGEGGGEQGGRERGVGVRGGVCMYV